jgi:hypothetical protein
MAIKNIRQGNLRRGRNEFSNSDGISTLSNLTVSAGALTPSFSSTTTAYSLTVAFATSTTTVTPTATRGASATIRVNNSVVASGAASGSISLLIGANVITVNCVSPDGTATSSYTITITRQGNQFFTPVPGAKPNHVLHASNGTFTVPANVYWLDVIVVGGGGSGGSLANPQGDIPRGGNGGGGGVSFIRNQEVFPGQAIPYTIGGGGASSTSWGNNGGDTLWDNVFRAVGGGGGAGGHVTGGSAGASGGGGSSDWNRGGAGGGGARGDTMGNLWWSRPGPLSRRNGSSDRPAVAIENRSTQGNVGGHGGPGGGATCSGGGGGAAGAASGCTNGPGYTEPITGQTWGSGGTGSGYGAGGGGSPNQSGPSGAGVQGVIMVKY